MFIQKNSKFSILIFLMSLLALGKVSAQCNGFQSVKIANKFDQDVITSKTHSVPSDIYTKVLDCNYSNGTYYMMVKITWKGLFSGEEYYMKGWMTATNYKWTRFDVTWANSNLIGLELLWGGLEVISEESARNRNSTGSYSKSRTGTYRPRGSSGSGSSSSSSYKVSSTKFDKVWAEYGVWQDGKKGMKIHANFVVNNLKGQKCSLNAWFSFQNGNKLKDFNGRFKTGSGQVATYEYFTPLYDNTRFSDFVMFIPYDELHCTGTGKYNLRFNLGVYRGDTYIKSTSQYINFWYKNQ
ncbi:MAG: hypothetical protein MRZ79_06270 [Bacteroidia bacterium]|nr:hypothetical protein [Bacteroidia bacterium]